MRVSLSEWLLLYLRNAFPLRMRHHYPDYWNFHKRALLQPCFLCSYTCLLWRRRIEYTCFTWILLSKRKLPPVPSRNRQYYAILILHIYMVGVDFAYLYGGVYSNLFLSAEWGGRISSYLFFYASTIILIFALLKVFPIRFIGLTESLPKFPMRLIGIKIRRKVH